MNKDRDARHVFRTTEWGVVKDAAHAEEARRVRALGSLVRHYQPALDEYLRIQFGLHTQDREDLLQGFFMEKILKRNLLSTADRARGKFRSFLLKSINHYVLDQFKREKAEKRSPNHGAQSLDLLLNKGNEFEAQIGKEIFEDALARQLIVEAVQRTHGVCMEKNLRDVWEIFHARILGPLFENKSAVSYQELQMQLGLESISATQNKLGSAKRIFKREFENLVAAFASDRKEWVEEINYFQKFLKNSGKKSGVIS